MANQLRFERRARSFPRWILFAMLIVTSWVTMILAHELGHIIGGWIGGATLVDFDLRPWNLPYSLHSSDPVPLLTLWAGPMLGCAVPIVFAICLRDRRVWFVADFCLLANGCYLALAWFSGDHLLDTARLFQAGASRLSVFTFCLITIIFGYFRFRTDCSAILASIPTRKNSVQPNKD